MRMKAATAALVLGGLTTALAACGEDQASGRSTQSQPGHNEADIEFSQGMIPHHAQALTMADLTRGRDLDPQVQAIADDIMPAQTPEIESMSDWLMSWDEEVPETMRDHANAEEGGAHHEMLDNRDNPGMMTAEEMSALATARDEAFQDMWLSMMIEHHRGAIDMADVEQADGRYRPAIDLAEEIEASQTKQVSAMEGLLR